MRINYLEILVEEPSAEAFLLNALPRLLPDGVNFSIYTYNGKFDLLKKLPSRIKGYSKWLPANHGIVVLVDNDRNNCSELKLRLEETFEHVDVYTKTRPGPQGYSGITRIAIEELEAWYFGNWPAVTRAYSSLPSNVPTRAAYRNSDSIAGGSWEAFERVCQQNGLFKGGLRKVEAAQQIGSQIAAEESSSPSFDSFVNGLRSLVEQN